MNANNTCILHGRLTALPELKKTASGTSIVTGTIAVQRNYKNKDGTIPCDFLPYKVFEQKAEFLSTWGQKGTELILETEARMEEWEKNGEKKSRVVFVINDIAFVGGRKKEEEPETLADGEPIPF